VIATGHSSSAIASEGWFANADLPLVRQLGLRAAMTVPLAVGVPCFGALTLFRSDDRPYSAHELALAEELGRRAALAIEHARLYEQAREAIAQRDQTLAIVTHDLRSPLQTIALATANLREAEVEASRWTTGHGLERIQRAADRMNRLIGDLADFESIAAGRLSVVTTPHTVTAIVEESVASCAAFANRRNVALTYEVASGLPRVQCDRDRVLQVIGNLVDNAIKVATAGDSVSVRASPLDHEVVFSVSDTGPGIPLADQGHLFDRYWRGPNSRYRGTGLGLAIARAIVEAHRGRIWVESEPGRGTTFHFTIPVAAPPLVSTASAYPELSTGPQ
jgi:signal transduction histidine kinase